MPALCNPDSSTNSSCKDNSSPEISTWTRKRTCKLFCPSLDHICFPYQWTMQKWALPPLLHMFLPYLCSGSSFPALQVTPRLLPHLWVWSLAKDTVWENGGFSLPNTAAVAGRHPRWTASRPPGHPFVSGRRHEQWVPGSLGVKVVLKIPEAIVQTLYFWVMRVGNEYECIQAFAFLEFLENTVAFHGIRSSQHQAGGRQSCISLQMCCSLHGSPAEPARRGESCQLFREGASESLQWKNSCCALPSLFKVQIQWHTVASQPGCNFIISSYRTC